MSSKPLPKKDLRPKSSKTSALQDLPATTTHRTSNATSSSQQSQPNSTAMASRNSSRLRLPQNTSASHETFIAQGEVVNKSARFEKSKYTRFESWLAQDEHEYGPYPDGAIPQISKDINESYIWLKTLVVWKANPYSMIPAHYKVSWTEEIFTYLGKFALVVLFRRNSNLFQKALWFAMKVENGVEPDLWVDPARVILASQNELVKLEERGDLTVKNIVGSALPYVNDAEEMAWSFFTAENFKKNTDE